MENTTNSGSNQNDGPRPNLNNNSIDGFSRPAQPQAQTSPNNDAVVSSISIPPSNENMSSDTNSSSSNQDNGSPVLSAPITTGGMDHKKSKIWTIILIILLLVVFVGGVYGVYMYQQKKIDSLNTQVTSLTSQNELLKKQLNTKTAPSVSINTQSNSATQTVIKIPELGVSFTVPANLADLTYVMNSTKTQANLSSQNLATLDPACTASATVAPLGSVVKANGQYPTTTSTTTTLIKQYPTYYIAYVKPTTACSKIAQVNTLANALMADFAKTYTTIALIST